MPNPLIASKLMTYPDFGKWLTYAESVKSETAIRHGIVNVPNPSQYANMQVVYAKVFAPLCEHFGKKLPVTSFFRSVALNQAIGGSSSTSGHMAGQCIDIDCDGLIGGPTNKELFAYVSQHMQYDQVILEYADANGNPQWVHVGYKLAGNRQQRLRKRFGQVHYELLP